MEDKDCCVNYDSEKSSTAGLYYGLEQKSQGCTNPAYETSEYNYRYETKAFYSNLIFTLINAGLYGPADIKQIADQFLEDYKKI